ncbi:MAG: ABC transporter substrate-binding protein [Actinomycetaceae bacterium]|nr:ABC transporter substrate-binding protein [Actinomycetaceae bacterium]
MHISKRVLSLSSAIVLGLTVSSCSNNASTQEDENAHVILTHTTEPTTNLLPAMCIDIDCAVILEHIYDGLVRYTHTGEVVFAVASSIETNDKGKTWDITLREDYVFSDGTPVTASSFVDAWNWAANSKNEALSNTAFAIIEGAEDEDEEHLSGLNIVSDHEFTVTLVEPNMEFTSILGDVFFFPLPQSALTDSESMNKQGVSPISNGTYVVQEWKNNEYIRLVPNALYRGGKATKNQGVLFKIYSDDTSIYNDLIADKLDLVYSIPLDFISVLEKDLGNRTVNRTGSVAQSIAIPYYLPHFSGEEGRLRRQAISMAIDRDEICTQLFSATRSPASDFVPAAIPGHTDSVAGSEVLSLNVEKAKDLWKQANEISPWGDSTFEIAYNADFNAHKAWVEAVVNQLNNNLDMNAQPKAYAQFEKLQDDMFNKALTSSVRLGWQVAYPSIYTVLENHKSNSVTNIYEYKNSEFDSVLSSAHAQENVSDRLSGYQKAQEILMKDLPIIPLWTENILGGYSTNVSKILFQWNGVPVYSDIEK